jgi:hypothetical protein
MRVIFLRGKNGFCKPFYPLKSHRNTVGFQ